MPHEHPAPSGVCCSHCRGWTYPWKPYCSLCGASLPPAQVLAYRSSDLTYLDDARPAPGSPKLLALCDRLKELHLRKAKDYGTDADPFANVRASAGWGIQPWVGAMVRLNDKVVRLQTLAKTGTLANEPPKESFLDISEYGLIAHCLYYEGRSDE